MAGVWWRRCDCAGAGRLPGVRGRTPSITISIGGDPPERPPGHGASHWGRIDLVCRRAISPIQGGARAVAGAVPGFARATAPRCGSSARVPVAVFGNRSAGGRTPQARLSVSACRPGIVHENEDDFAANRSASTMIEVEPSHRTGRALHGGTHPCSLKIATPVSRFTVRQRGDTSLFLRQTTALTFLFPFAIFLIRQ